MTTILEKPGFNPDKKYKIIGQSPVKHDGFDKVTGRAKFAADAFLPGMLVGKFLRSPHPHAILKKIDVSKAAKLPGVKAIVTRDDFPEIKAGTGAGDMTRIAMAREKVYWEGHPVAAVALVWLAGGPATIDMWDNKPEAPEGIRGEFKSIDTKAQGVQFAEHLESDVQSLAVQLFRRRVLALR